MPTAIIIVDHGSRRDQSNRMLEEVAALFAQRFEEKYDIVEPAHLEIAEPSVASAYARCVARGRRRWRWRVRRSPYGRARRCRTFPRSAGRRGRRLLRACGCSGD